MTYTEGFYKRAGDYRFMKLTPEEVKEVRYKHEMLSIGIMKECIIQTHLMVTSITNREKIVRNVDIATITAALFDKRCPQLFTMMKNKLYDKIEKEIPDKFITGSVTKENDKLREEKIKFDEESV